MSHFYLIIELGKRNFQAKQGFLYLFLVLSPALVVGIQVFGPHSCQGICPQVRRSFAIWLTTGCAKSPSPSSNKA